MFQAERAASDSPSHRALHPLLFVFHRTVKSRWQFGEARTVVSYNHSAGRNVIGVRPASPQSL